MSSRAATLSYPFQDPPAPGFAGEIGGGILWLRMPMPFALNHINLWALAEKNGWAIVDSGLRTTEVTLAWQALLAPQGPLGGLGISRVIATHMHPDHIGMAGWLARRFGCPLWMTRLEYLSCRMLAADTGRDAPAAGVEFYRKAGWSDAEVERYQARFGDFGRMIHALPDSFVRLTDGQLLNIGGRNWEVIVGAGHSPEHACLYSPELDILISGDQVLPKISSNTSVYPTEPQADPIAEWLHSIERLKQRVPHTALTLPAHDLPFYGLHVRLDQLQASTERSLRRLLTQLSEPMRAIDLVRALFRSSIISEQAHLGMATGETLALLNHLRQRGEVTAEEVDGVIWYRATESVEM